MDLSALGEGVDIGPFCSIDGGLSFGSDKALELSATSDEDDAGEVAVITELDGGGGRGDVGVEVTAVFFDDAPVAGGVIPAIARFLDGEGSP